MQASLATPIAHQPVRERIGEMLALLQGEVPIVRRVLHAGERVYQSGERFDCLHVVHAGFFKTVNQSADGREQTVGLHFKGDWLGFDGIADGHFGCDAVALVDFATARLVASFGCSVFVFIPSNDLGDFVLFQFSFMICNYF